MGLAHARHATREVHYSQRTAAVGVPDRRSAWLHLPSHGKASALHTLISLGPKLPNEVVLDGEAEDELVR